MDYKNLNLSPIGNAFQLFATLYPTASSQKEFEYENNDMQTNGRTM